MKWMPLTSSSARGRAPSISPAMISSNPLRIPTTPTFSSSARIVAAAITLLMPGAGPPPTRLRSLPTAGASGKRREMLDEGGGHHAGHLVGDEVADAGQHVEPVRACRVVRRPAGRARADRPIGVTPEIARRHRDGTD